MVDFFNENLDSIIISTVFLFLGFFPNIFSFIKNKLMGNKTYSSNINLNRSNNNIIGNNNIINNSYNTYSQFNHYEYNHNINTSSNDINSTSSSDVFIEVILIVIISFIFLILFYQHIYAILKYSISINVSSLILLIFIFKNLSLLDKNDRLFYSKSVWTTIAIRNIFFCIAVLINLLVISYNLKHTIAMDTFINIVTNPNNNDFSQNLLLVKDFICNSVMMDCLLSLWHLVLFILYS